MRTAIRSVFLALGLAICATPAAAASRMHDFDLKMPPAAEAGTFTGFSPCRFLGLKSRPTDSAECGALVVAEDRARPQGRLLVLPVVKLPATAPTKLSPLFYFQGGPGSTNLNYSVEAPSVMRTHDIYMLGYRGSDDLVPLQCPEVMAAVLEPKPLSDATRAAITAASRACAERFKRAGVDLSRYRMVDVIADYEDLRRELGIATVNLIGTSYGTRVEQYYARLHPAAVSHSVLLSANPPGHFTWFPETTGAVLEAHSKLCAANPACASQTQDLHQTVLSVLSRPDGDVEGAPIDMDRVRIVAFFQLMNRDSALQLFHTLVDAEKGDARGLVRLSEMYGAIVPNAFIWGDANSKAGTDCDPDDAAFIARRLPSRQSIGSPLDFILHAACLGWPVEPPPPGFSRAARDPTSTLIVGGDLDISTPLRYVQSELMPSLPNGHLVIIQGEGHTGWRGQPEALDRLLSTFLATGQGDASLLKPVPLAF